MNLDLNLFEFQRGDNWQLYYPVKLLGLLHQFIGAGPVCDQMCLAQSNLYIFCHYTWKFDN